LRAHPVRLKAAKGDVERNDIKSLISTDNVEAPTVFIFDQFEEIFDMKRTRSERHDFFRSLGDFLDKHSETRGFFAIREEWLAELQEYALDFPNSLDTSTRLEPVDREAAEHVISSCFERFGKTFELSALKCFLDELTDSDGFVEPVQLQVVCLELWEKVRLLDSIITDEYCKTHVKVAESLRRYYESGLTETSDRTGVRVSTMRSWFDSELITTSHTRGLSWRGEKKTGPVPNLAVDLLEARHLIRAEIRSGERWYEISHDRLVKPILQSNSGWRRNLRFIRYGLTSLVILALISAVITFERIAASANVAKREAQTARDDAFGKKLIIEMQRSTSGVRDDEHDLLMLAASKILSPSEPLLNEILSRVLSNPFLITQIRRNPAPGVTAWAPSGNYFAIASRNLEIWKIDHHISALQPPTPCNCSAIAWSPDGRAIALGRVDGELSILSWPDLKVKLSARHHSGRINSIAWYPDSTLVATGGEDRQLLLWDYHRRQDSPRSIELSPIARKPTDFSSPLGLPTDSPQVAVPTVPIHALSFSRDGKLAMGGYDDSLSVFESLLTPRHQLGRFRSAVLSVSWSADGKLASGGKDNTVRIWDDHEEQVKRVASTARVSSVAWSSDGKSVLAASEDTSAVLVIGAGVDSKDSMEEYQSAGGPTKSLAISPVLGTVLVVSDSGAADLWFENRGKLPQSLGRAKYGITSVAFSSDGTLVGTGSKYGILEILDRKENRVSELRGPFSKIDAICITDQLIWAVGDDSKPPGSIAVWNRRNSGDKKTNSFNADITSISVSDNVWTGTADGHLLQWKFETVPAFRRKPSFVRLRLAGSPVKIEDSGRLTAIAVGRNGHLYAANESGRIFESDPSAGLRPTAITPSCSAAVFTAFSLNGDYVATSCGSTVELRKLSSGSKVGVLSTTASGITTLAWSMDSQKIAYGTTNGSVGLFDVSQASNSKSSPFPGHQGPVVTVAFGDNGQSLVSGGSDGVLLYWSSLDIFKQDPCAFVHRSLDRDEWRQSFGPGVPFRNVCE
jgi:WD40 repeat protein